MLGEECRLQPRWWKLTGSTAWALEKLPSLSFLIPSRDELVHVEYPVLTGRSVRRSEGLGLPAWVWPGIYLTPYLFLQVHLLSFFVCFVGF